MTPTTVRRLLCATDLSPAATPAWEEAQLLGALFAAEVLLLHVVPPALPAPLDGSLPPSLVREVWEAGQRQARAGLDQLVGGLADPGLKVSARIEEGSPARRILEVAREDAVDLVVLGTNGRGRPRSVFLGSVADGVVRHASCPVVTVPARRGDAPPTSPQLRRVCYATDFSAGARAAWPWVLAVAGAASAEVDLLHVTAAPVADPELPAESIGRMARLLRAQGEAEAERFLRACPLPADRVHVVLGSGVVAEQILHVARERGADLIAMGTHGWSGLLRWTLGSIAHHVVQTAPVPVLTVGPGSRSEEGADAA